MDGFIKETFQDYEHNQEFFRLFSELNQLGKGREEFFDYVNYVICGINALEIKHSINAGFMAGIQLHLICQAIIDELYHIDSNPDLCAEANKISYIYSEFEDRLTRINYLFVHLNDMFYTIEAKQYMSDQQKGIATLFETKAYKEKEIRLKSLIGDTQVEILLNQLLDFFYVIPCLDGYRQGFNNELLYAISYLDQASGKTVIQHWFEKNTKN